MESPTTSAAALRLEIARISGAIDRHKSGESSQRSIVARPRSNIYVNPNYKPQSRPTSVFSLPSEPLVTPPTIDIVGKRDVVLGGVAFESSRRSLVRKDLPKPSTKPPSSITANPTSRPPLPPKAEYARTKTGHLIQANRTYKAKPSRGRSRTRGHNMTLNNTRRPYLSKAVQKRIKYSDKPCPRFTTTGACSRGLTCMYQHDASKIAICWNFLQGTCPNSAATCNLSHDPIPERTPPCMHFANNGRCTRVGCPFPHVRLGQREGVCRDFAVLGYCDKGLDCDQQHVRECPDFAEKGTCPTKRCKLPHVIRANRNRKPVMEPFVNDDMDQQVLKGHDVPSSNVDANATFGTDDALHVVTASDAQLGDEFISLTFNESESSEEDEDSEQEEEESDDQKSS